MVSNTHPFVFENYPKVDPSLRSTFYAKNSNNSLI